MLHVRWLQVSYIYLDGLDRFRPLSDPELFSLWEVALEPVQQTIKVWKHWKHKRYLSSLGIGMSSPTHQHPNTLTGRHPDRTPTKSLHVELKDGLVRPRVKRELKSVDPPFLGDSHGIPTGQTLTFFWSWCTGNLHENYCLFGRRGYSLYKCHSKKDNHTVVKVDGESSQQMA